MTRLVTLLFHDLYTRGPSESGFSGPAADRYKMSVALFDRQILAIRREREDQPVLIRNRQDGDRADNAFAITVDDGGLSYYTQLADRIEEQGWRGHCLVTTGCLGKRGFLEAHHLRELHARGHVIGSHTVSHPARLHACKWQTLVEEWRQSRQTLEDLTGAPVRVGSVPGGYYGERVALAAQEAGLEALFTSEPQRTLRRVGDCRVAGRYALRRDSSPDLAGRLVGQRPARLFQEWAVWNAKKAARVSLGAGYEQLTRFIKRAG